MISRSLLVYCVCQNLFIAVQLQRPHAVADVVDARIAPLQLRSEIIGEFEAIAFGDRNRSRAIDCCRAQPLGSELLLGQLVFNQVTCRLMGGM